MPRHPDFDLSLDTLRSLSGWCVALASEVLPLYAAKILDDSRPREALEEATRFAEGGPRTHRLRVVALAALVAAREASDPAASAAAKACGLAASSAYTHPLADADQTKHILGPGAWAAWSRELASADPSIAERMVLRAGESAPAEVSDLLRKMPARRPGKSRTDTLMAILDRCLRGA